MQYYSWIYVFCTLIVAIVTVIGLKEKNLSLGKIDILFILYAGILLFSTILTDKTPIVTDRIYILIGYFIFYFITQLAIDKNKNLDWVWMGIILIFVVQAIQGVLQFNGITSPANKFFKTTGTFINPGPYGGFLAPAPSILIYYCKLYFHKKKYFYPLLCGCLLIISAIVLSGSRAAWMASIVSIMVTVIILWIKKLGLFLKQYRSTLIIIGLGITTLFLTFLIQLKLDSSLGRIFIWKVSFNIFKDHPLLGIGYDRFEVEYGNYQANYFQNQFGISDEIRIAGMNYFAFNEYLRVLIENGVFGFLLFVALIYSGIKSVLLQIRKIKPLILPLSTLIAILVYALFSYPFSIIPISLLFFFSLSVISLYEKKFNPLIVYKLSINNFSRGIIICMVAFMVYNVSKKIKAINTWQHAQQNLLFREKESWSDYQKVYPILDNNGIFLFNYGAELSAGGYHKESLVVLRNAKLFFTSATLHLHLGNNYKALKNYKMAEKEYQTAHYMVPNLFFPLNCLFELYKEKKETKKALEIALKIHHMPIKVYSDQVKEIKKSALVYIYGSK